MTPELIALLGIGTLLLLRKSSESSLSIQAKKKRSVDLTPTQLMILKQLHVARVDAKPGVPSGNWGWCGWVSSADPNLSGSKADMQKLLRLDLIEKYISERSPMEGHTFYRATQRVARMFIPWEPGYDAQYVDCNDAPEGPLPTSNPVPEEPDE